MSPQHRLTPGRQLPPDVPRTPNVSRDINVTDGAATNALSELTPSQQPAHSNPCPPQLPTFRIRQISHGVHTMLMTLPMHELETAYSKVVHWRLNSFKVPTGKAGKEFFHELSCLFSAFASASSMESVALIATIVMPILLL